MSVQFCLALLALSSLTAAADPDCEELTKPLEDRSQVSGKWIYHVGTTSTEEGLKELKAITNSWLELSPIAGSEDLILRWADKVGEKCVHGSVNSTYTGNSTLVTFTFNITSHEHTGTNLKTCPDCMVWSDTAVSISTDGEIKKSKNLYLFTKSGKLDDAHLEVFKKQAACLDFPAEFHFGGDTDLCPDEKEAATD